MDNGRLFYLSLMPDIIVKEEKGKHFKTTNLTINYIFISFMNQATYFIFNKNSKRILKNPQSEKQNLQNSAKSFNSGY